MNETQPPNFTELLRKAARMEGGLLPTTDEEVENALKAIEDEGAPDPLPRTQDDEAQP